MTQFRELSWSLSQERQLSEPLVLGVLLVHSPPPFFLSLNKLVFLSWYSIYSKISSNSVLYQIFAAGGSPPCPLRLFTFSVCRYHLGFAIIKWIPCQFYKFGCLPWFFGKVRGSVWVSSLRPCRGWFFEVGPWNCVTIRERLGNHGLANDIL